MEVVSGGRRLIDRVLDADFISDLASLPVKQIRERRQAARQEEANLSYLRRMLQGRIEILEAENEARAEGFEGSLVDRLTDVLTSIVSSPPGKARVSEDPDRMSEDRRSAERLIADVGLSSTGDLDEEKAQRALDRLRLEERSVSTYRTKVHQIIHSLTMELGTRYRKGEAGRPGQ